MNYFDHEKLDVYQAAIDLVTLINSVVENLPRGRAYLADQLQRAGTSGHLYKLLFCSNTALHCFLRCSFTSV